MKDFICFAWVLLLGFTSQQGFSQSIEQDLRKMNAAYEKAERLSMDASFYYFKTENAVEPTETQSATIKKDGQFYYSKMGKVEIVKDARHSLVIDSENKVIAISKTASSSNPLDQIVVLDSMLKLANKITPVIRADARGHKLEFKYGEIASITLLFDKNYFIKNVKVVYRRNEGTDMPVLDIRYANINTNPTFPKGIFSLGKYVVTSQDKIKLTPAYSSYKLLTQM